MPLRKAVAVVFLASLSLLSCSEKKQAGDPVMVDESLHQDLMLLQDQRIFFGHQSVGVNVVEGINDILAQSKDVHFNMISLKDSVQLPDAFFADSFVGQNSKPNSKCDAFAELISRSLSDKLDIALMKFCYVDIRGNTDVEAVFDYYRSTMDSLKARHPHIEFVHVTVPITLRTSAWKRTIKSVLGMEDKSTSEAVKRNMFNTLLVNHYKDDPIFNIADVESTYPDGSRKAFVADGKTYYMLVDEYTDDGGHLNAVGRKVVAKALVHTLAEVVRKRQHTATAGR